MKALILAAGLGTRLRPLTNKVPKPLIKVGNKPLLEHTLTYLNKYGFDKFLINSHYLSNKIKKFASNYEKKHTDIKIKVTYEPTLLGSGGTLLKNKNYFVKEKTFLVYYGDNLTNVNIKKVLNFHRQKNGVATIVSYYEKNPESKGIIEFDRNKKIKLLKEKPKPEEIKSHYANAGIYVFNNQVFSFLKNYKKYPIDFAKDILPILIKKTNVYIYIMNDYFIDIGTIDSYNQAKKKINKLFKIL